MTAFSPEEEEAIYQATDEACGRFIKACILTGARPWTRTNCVLRFLRLKKRLHLPEDRCMYSFRHTFAKRTSSGNYTGKPVTIEVLAGLMGNSARVCREHYAQWADRYISPLWAALGKNGERDAGQDMKPRVGDSPERLGHLRSS